MLRPHACCLNGAQSVEKYLGVQVVAQMGYHALLFSRRVSLCAVPEAVYDAASPDELAFVAGAQECGVELYNRPSRRVVQLRLLTQFAQKWIMQPALYDKWLSWLDSNAGNKRVLDDEHQSIWVPIIDIELLNIFEFDAERRRMSVIIR